MSNAVCTHLDQIAVRELPASVEGCEDCLRTGGKWLHLRICLTCGHVACCDDSPNRHATAHAHATSHPIIRSLEPGEDWNWCYVDEVGVPRRRDPRQDPHPAVAAPAVTPPREHEREPWIHRTRRERASADADLLALVGSGEVLLGPAGDLFEGR